MLARVPTPILAIVTAPPLASSCARAAAIDAGRASADTRATSTVVSFRP
mgnify:CR=1 FL=1